MGKLSRKKMMTVVKVILVVFAIWAVPTAYNEIGMYRTDKYWASWERTFKAEMENKWHMSFRDIKDWSGDVIGTKGDNHDARSGLDIVCDIRVEIGKYGPTMERVVIVARGMDEKTLDKAARDLFKEAANAPLAIPDYDRARVDEWIQSQLEGPGSDKTTIGDTGVFVWLGRAQKILAIGYADDIAQTARGLRSEKAVPSSPRLPSPSASSPCLRVEGSQRTKSPGFLPGPSD